MIQQRKLEAVIFDMDGVLIDSLSLHIEADTQLFQEYSIDITEVDFSPFLGMSNPEIWALVIKEYGLTAPLEAILQRSMELKLAALKKWELKPIEGIPGLLAALRQAALPCAVASSSSPSFINAALGKTGIRPFFSVIVSGEEVAKSKPEPDVFLKAAELLGVAPENCVVIEDSGNGVVAAKRAGMKCAAYKNPSSLRQDISLADVVADRISQITVEGLRALWSRS
jgi:HAD superfamily hydrolase (TIGR01509 family)